jgi:cytochrome c
MRERAAVPTALLLCVLSGAAAAELGGPWRPGLGQSADPLTIDARDGTVLPDGSDLPPGRGDVATGRAVYRQHCLACHGPEGKGGPNGDLAGGLGTLATEAPVKTVNSYWPYATTVFDYVRRAMPYPEPGSLADEDVYALVAYVLSLDGIVPEDAVLDAERLPAVVMPNRDGFVEAWPPR